ncbi:carbon monoxide dehydrogenase [Burkholderia sp. WAC0059]|uniref:CoxG family protein n=1 Tax=Burkholderia sp. WAC0059 TaxID=2066022 RepID=UPI000C7F1FEE|nr:carbon monoxide dehydrogenase subunit G [Burkholderia sp. WAC0059]PLZ02303.1 carbon monoxide dehydrogenase [Burkholderia sp. WAC0059]
MELTERYTLPVSQQRAWEALNDTTILRASIPGCEQIDSDGGGAYALSMSASIGPVKARFKGRIRLADVDAPRAYTLVFEGQGDTAGFGQGRAHVTLEAAGTQTTTLSYSANARLEGKLARIGSRFVDAAVRRLVDEFFRRFHAQLGTRGTAPAILVPATTTTSHAATQPADGAIPDRRRSWTAWISKS